MFYFILKRHIYCFEVCFQAMGKSEEIPITTMWVVHSPSKGRPTIYIFCKQAPESVITQRVANRHKTWRKKKEKKRNRGKTDG